MSNSGVAVDIEGDMDGGKSWLSIYPLINMTKQPGPLRLREMPVPPVTFWSTTLPLLAERLQFANADPNRIREFSIRQCDGTCESITIIPDTAVMPKLKRVDVNYIASKVDVVQQVVDDINDEVKKLSVIDRHLPGWALNNANAKQLKLCPTVVIILASQRIVRKISTRGSQMLWSKIPGGLPFEISVDRKWMVTVAPWLRIVVNIGAELDLQSGVGRSQEFPLFPKKTKEMKSLIDALGVKENMVSSRPSKKMR
ncbi:hypothetical protein MHU86_25239 [Fragilaria crotonensis]|nr:hypothetical protein MHU86_25239 [Fragilaria crotonensis]